MTRIPAFCDPVHDAQRTFRCALEAVARPATWWTLPDVPESLPGFSRAATALALTLLDQDVAVWLGPKAREAAGPLRFACGVATVAAPQQADFAFVTASELDSLTAFAHGSEIAPETGATVVVQVPPPSGDSGLRCSGPGLAKPTPLHCDGLQSALISERCHWQADTSRGVDLFLVADRSLAALPRSVHLEEVPCTQP